MSNPYDPNAGNNPYDPGAGSNNPYGTPGQGGGYGAPYGQGGGYGAPPYGQPDPWNQAPKKTDAVSITAFVLSLTFCLSIVGAIMGFIGLGRTKNGQRNGRWAAISASIIGPILTIFFALGVVGIVYVVKNSVTVDNAEVGQCVDIDDQADEVSFTKKECTESHDAEVFVVGRVSDFSGDFGAVDPEEICRDVGSADDIAAVDELSSRDRVRVNVVLNDPDNFDSDDRFFCYVELTSGSLDEKVTP